MKLYKVKWLLLNTAPELWVSLFTPTAQSVLVLYFVHVICINE